MSKNATTEGSVEVKQDKMKKNEAVQLTEGSMQGVPQREEEKKKSLDSAALSPRNETYRILPSPILSCPTPNWARDS